MYKNRNPRRGASSSKVPIPVVVTQKPNEDEFPDKPSDDNLIPSSQEVPSSQPAEPVATQSRFLSQRHQYARATQESQMRGKNYFEIALISCKMNVTDLGCEFVNEGDDPISFIRRFRSFLSSHQTNNDNARKFIDGFKKIFSLKAESIEVAQKFMSGLIMKEGQRTHQSQTSLVQCFLAVSSLTADIANLLLENLKAYVKDRDEHADRFIVGLVVAQFKFSDQLLASATYDVMYDEFFVILGETKSDACREVIISNFRDLDEFKQDDAVKRLMDLYADRQELLTPFIETFTEMCISDGTKTRISSLVQHLLETNCAPKLYPGIVKYLLYYMQAPTDIADSLRKHLKWSAEANAVKVKVIQLLEKSVRSQKSKIADAWIKVVGGLEKPEELKLLDFIMLLVTLSVKEEKFPAVKKILIQKVPAGFFSFEFLADAFKTFPRIIAQYSSSLLEMLSALQKNDTYEINEFSSACFRMLFTLAGSDKKEIIGTLVQFLCEKAPQLPFTSKSDFKTMTLNILSGIKNKEALLVNHKILLRVLDNSKVKLTHNEHRLVMELLCALTYTTDYTVNPNLLARKKLEEDRAVLQEHLEMLCNKLMCNPEMKIKQLGIIGGIKIVSSLVVDVVASSELSDVRDVSFDDIPPGTIKQAAKRMLFILEAVKGSAHGLAMVCDEASLEFLSKGRGFTINAVFLTWLCELMFKKLDDLIAFNMTTELPELPDVKLEHKLFVKDFPSPDTAVGLGVLVYRDSSADVVAAPALFKLMRLLMLHRFQNLREIHSMSVMPITLTDNFGSPDDELNEFDDAGSKLKLDLYFHCANWLRELIGAYIHWSTDDRAMLVECVRIRVKQLVQVEKRLIQLVAAAPSSYYPPAANFLEVDSKKRAFDSLRKEAKAPPKKARKKNNATVVAIKGEEAIEATNKLRQFCREIDTQAMLLLNEDFKFASEALADEEFGLHELMFLLDEVHNKIVTACNPRSFFDPIQTIKDLKATLIPFLVALLQKIRDELISMSQRAQRDESNEVFFTTDANLLKNCFCLILQMFDMILSCPKLKLEKNSELLLEALKSLVPADEMLANVDELDQTCFLIIEYGIGFEKNVKNCESAVALVKFLQTISGFSSNEEQRSLVQQLCESFLKKEWKNASGDGEHGAAFNTNLEKLLQAYVNEMSLDSVMALVVTMAEDVKGFAKEKATKPQKTFPSFTKGNSNVMMRSYMQRLSLIIGTTEPFELKFDFWRKSATAYNLLKGISKEIDTQSAYIVFLKNFLPFIRVFNVHGPTALNPIIHDKKKFVELVKSVQDVTRFSHGVSCHLKSRKNKAVVAIIPKIREALTKFFQTMSVLLPSAKIPIADIFTGSLKNYNVFGDEISSQNTNETSDDERDDSMEISDDDTVGNLNLSVDEEVEPTSFRSRSTVF